MKEIVEKILKQQQTELLSQESYSRGPQNTSQLEDLAKKLESAIKTNIKTNNLGRQASEINTIEKAEKSTRRAYFAKVNEAFYYGVSVIYMLKGYDLTVTFSDDAGTTKISWVYAKSGRIGSIKFYCDIPEEKNDLAAKWGYISSSCKDGDEKPTVVGEIKMDCRYILNGTMLQEEGFPIILE